MSEGPERRGGLARWVPFAMFAGTTLALTVPLAIICQRQRRIPRSPLFTFSTESFRSSLTKDPTTTRVHTRQPPLAPASTTTATTPTPTSPSTTAFAAVNFARGSLQSDNLQPQRRSLPLHLARPVPLSTTSPSPPSSTSSSSDITEKSEDVSSPGPKELLSAISLVDSSTAAFAGKALVIATCLVAVGGFALTWGVKTATGVQDAREFAQRAREAVRTYLPSLSSSIHRLGSEEGSSNGEGTGVVVDADDLGLNAGAEESEKRLKLAYEQGGTNLLARTMEREMEAELQVERQKRELDKQQI